MSEEMNRSQERHLQTIMQVALIGLMGWMAFTVQAMTVQTATMSEKIANLTGRLDEIQLSSADRYTFSQAEKDLKIRDLLLEQLVDRIVKLESFHLTTNGKNTEIIQK